MSGARSYTCYGQSTVILVVANGAGLVARPSGPASAISLTEVKHGCVRSETRCVTSQMNDKTAHPAVLRKGY